MEHVFEAPAGPAGAAKPAPEVLPALPSSRIPLTAAPASVRSLTPFPRMRSQPPPKPVRPSVAPAAGATPSSMPPVSTRPSPPPPPSRRSTTQRPPAAAARPPVIWSGRDAARVSIVKSSTEPGLYYVRLIENGKAPVEGVEGLLVALDPDATLCP